MAAVVEKEAKRWFWMKEYWLADPANETLEILTLRKGHYELAACAAEKGNIQSQVLAGLEFDLAEILSWDAPG